MLEQNAYEELKSGILEALYEEYEIWDEHPDFGRNLWIDVVRAGDTNLGYWEWVADKVERLIDTTRPFQLKLENGEIALFGFERWEERVVVTLGPDQSIQLYLVSPDRKVSALAYSAQVLDLEKIRKVVTQEMGNSWCICNMLENQKIIPKIEEFILEQDSEYRCPDCGHEKIAVKAEVSVHLDKFGNSEDIDTTDPFFDGDSFAVCRNCGSEGQLKKFSL